jgi:hypothetical protein
MQLSAAERQGVDSERARLAGARTSDPRVRRAIDEAFLSGYRDVIWIAVGLALLSAASGQMIGARKTA